MKKWRYPTVILTTLMFVSAPVHAISFASAIQWFQTMQSEMSAWSTTVKQTALAATQVNQGERLAKQQLALSIGAMNASFAEVDAIKSFSGRFGQPDSIKCQAATQDTLNIQAVQQAEKDTAHLMQNFANTRVTKASVTDALVLASRRDTYCTVSEAKQGLCELIPNGMQGWDANYSGAFNERTLAPEGELAAYAYTAMVADSRATADLDCDSLACEAAQSNHIASAALMAMAAHSFVGQAVDRRIPVMTGQ